LHTLSAPAIILLINGIILLLLSISYPKKYFACDKPITIAEAVVKPEITEWLMKRISHPSLKKTKDMIGYSYNPFRKKSQA